MVGYPYLEWGQDLVLNPNGGIAGAVGWDKVRQGFIRFLLTNYDAVEPSGIRVLPDYIFHPGYGLGLRVLIGENFDDDIKDQMKQKCLTALAAFPEVAQDPQPEVLINQTDSHTIELFINVFLADGTPGQLALELSP